MGMRILWLSSSVLAAVLPAFPQSGDARPARQLRYVVTGGSAFRGAQTRRRRRLHRTDHNRAVPVSRPI
jgi:hypothetical protein